MQIFQDYLSASLVPPIWRYAYNLLFSLVNNAKFKPLKTYKLKKRRQDLKRWLRGSIWGQKEAQKSGVRRSSITRRSAIVAKKALDRQYASDTPFRTNRRRREADKKRRCHTALRSLPYFYTYWKSANTNKQVSWNGALGELSFSSLRFSLAHAIRR